MILSCEEYYELGFDGGEDEQECERAISRSERMIDLLTDGKCRNAEQLPEAQLLSLKQAIAAQAEQYLTVGAGAVPARTVVGDFSYTIEGDSISAVSPLAMAILKLSGLFYRGTRCSC